MKQKVLFLVLIFVTSWVQLVQAQTVVWSTPPSFDAVEEYTDYTYKVRQNGKVGLANASGTILIEARYDSITPWHEDLALALVRQNSDYQIQGIISRQNISFSPVKDKCLLMNEYPYFSEGRLPVRVNAQSYGQLKSSGELVVVECDYIYPYHQGFAAFQTGNMVDYLNLKDDIMSPPSIDGYEATMFVQKDIINPSFNAQGKAVIYAKGSPTSSAKFYLLDTRGRIQSIDKSAVKRFAFETENQTAVTSSPWMQDNQISVFSEEGLWGYKNADGSTLLHPQLNDAKPFYKGVAAARTGGKYGFLKLAEGSVSGSLLQDHLVIKDNQVKPVELGVSIPPEYAGKDITVLLHGAEEGRIVPQFKEKTDLLLKYDFTPTISNKKERIKSYLVSVSSEGLNLWRDSLNLSLTYTTSISLVLGLPSIDGKYETDGEGYVRADKNDCIALVAEVKNQSDQVINTTIRMTGMNLQEQTQPTVSISPGGVHRIQALLTHIRNKESIEVCLETDRGERKCTTIKVKPFINQ